MALTLGKVNTGNLVLGSNGGLQPTASSTGVTLGQGTINQTPITTGGGGVGTTDLSGGGGVITAPVGPTDAQLSPLLSALSSLDTVLANRNKQSNDEYGRAIAGYNAQDAIDAAAHGQNVTQNEQTLTANDQAALLNAANGASGLRGVLSSLGGLAGSGMDVIRRLVGLAANSDAGAARQTFDTNANNLNTAWSQTTQAEKQRRADADATLQNNLQNNKADVLNSRQGIYQQLANLWGADTAQGADYASKAGALAAPIAATTKATVAPYAAASSLFSPAALQSYLAGTQNLNAAASGNDNGGSATPINSPVYSTRRKDTLPGVA